MHSVRSTAEQPTAPGDHSEVRSLTAAARRVRQQALAAHAEAAEGILAANNEARGLVLLELDLHGLHAQEAIHALQLRLQLLESQTGDSQIRLQPLRVIVGRGNHSSEGEASLPRVVASYLTGANYRFNVKGGALDITLKRPAVCQAAGTHPP
ncbi:hypothetical protein WJX72_009044 [[Myrmecia] bisecta]|uniref:Smr domain-containing protein n=1 Tax=[Myrmecia] bisecta TaxID=41462 RepID=A0AAW1Q5B6_9CHLO